MCSIEAVEFFCEAKTVFFLFFPKQYRSIRNMRKTIDFFGFCHFRLRFSRHSLSRRLGIAQKALVFWGFHVFPVRRLCFQKIPLDLFRGLPHKFCVTPCSWLRQELKKMKICIHSMEFDSDLFRLFGPFADLHPAVEKLFRLLGDYCAGLTEAQLQVDKSDSETRVVRLVTANAGCSIFLVVPFLETEQTIALLRVHAIELPRKAAA